MNSKHRLELVWPTKGERAHPEPRLLLEKQTFKSSRPGIRDNLLIQGDNLLGLKALEAQYTGRIKCVYIDPPYNTKSCFSHYDDSMEHSLWLDMMKARLVILHRLLRIDGTIWISIDDDECHYLKVLCDEIFGRKNFVANLIWEKKYSPQNDAKWVSDTHDHILVYAKCIQLEHWGTGAKKGLNLLPRTEDMNARYKNLDNDRRGLWMSDNLSVKTYSPSCDYPIQTPSGRCVQPPAGSCWRITQDRLKELIKDNRIWFGATGNNAPRLKRFLSEVQDGTVAKTIWQRSEVGDNQEAKKEVKTFNSNDVFATPKPERLLERILYLATNKDDLVLDCFAGSGTTGAVAHKMGRRWIMIEMGNHAQTHIIPRLKMVIDGFDPGGITQSTNWEGGGGFRFFEIAPSLLQKDSLNRFVINPQYSPEMLKEAMCMHAGFALAGESKPWWCHGQSTQGDFIYITPTTLTKTQLARLSDEVGPNRSLLVFCGAFTCKVDEFDNLTIQKIPKSVLSKCEWANDDYSLKNTIKHKPIPNEGGQSIVRATVAAKRITKRKK